jgi:hypothetical protein
MEREHPGRLTACLLLGCATDSVSAVYVGNLVTYFDNPIWRRLARLKEKPYCLNMPCHQLVEVFRFLWRHLPSGVTRRRRAPF